MELPPVPEILVRLQENSEAVLRHLFPHAIIEDDTLYADPIQVNLFNLRWQDTQTRAAGELHQLWAYVKNQDVPTAKADIETFLLSADLPEGMVRFDVPAEILSDPSTLYGERMPIWDDINLYAGTTTLLAGYNGSGKSTLATQIALMCIQDGLKAFILSPEMPPTVTHQIIARQSNSVSNPMPAEWDRMNQHIRDNVIFSTEEDRITPQLALQQFDGAYAAGCRLIILDSITCIRTGHELYQQADFADDLRAWSRSHPDCYLLVLAHMRKPAAHKGGRITRYDIRGAGEISDLAGHVWLLQRKDPFSQKELTAYGDYDARLIVDKKRATGKLTSKMLRFSPVQKLYHPTKQPPRYLDDVHGANVERIR